MVNTLTDITELPMEFADFIPWEQPEWTPAAGCVRVFDYFIAYGIHPVLGVGVVTVSNPHCGIYQVRQLARVMDTPLEDARATAECIVAAVWTAERPDHPLVVDRAA
ncbi:hypothetical protein DMC64_41940 [Amycolatopsis sp. WAC 04197]|uniref:hypothetical protein n=1 Tax=Amycolatopsis sp. WAC 04197 TaxID=2203199 RepID=UPI000F788A3E|nr:hypothetical protein [Amycolatopsis sp. WAC 04197]RSN38631.1 hypothetical protein DMC64_41940 [Amycolatopsis sp. WAC 04197]